MSADLHTLGRALLLIGAIVAGFGLILLCAPHIPWLGRLPGDLLIRRERWTFYFPLASCLVASVILTAIMWFVGRFRQ